MEMFWDNVEMLCAKIPIYFFVFFFKQKTAYEISACLVGSEMCIRDSYTTIDGRKAGEVTLADVRVPATARLGAAGGAGAALSAVIDRATLAVAAEAVGAMDSLLTKTVEYLSLIHISEPTRQAEISYAVFCLKKKKKKNKKEKNWDQ